ncbi:DUF4382 domain-containing protein [Natronorubrum sp. FCH18a]|uniref:DUF4382 domain-containing protein n=1 Tax=Natronorubrum sp. FCH18a TaxID=3447018 RepID=UPI003F5174B0
MTERPPNRDHDNPIERRTFIAAGSGLGAMLFAGCTSESAPADESDDESTDGESDSDGGNFRLLVSDMPADIGDFDRLDVTLDYARIFDGDDENGDGDEESDDQNGDDDNEADESSEEEVANEDEAGGNVERNRGFYTLDLEGATVDLTQVVGDKAIPVFEDELSPGTYEKIELHVEAIEGIVDGERANVKVPSEKLQITHPFEIGDDDAVDFVFDINVVKRGRGNDYNLTPVISESGVAGEDVEVEEVSGDGDDETAEDNDGESDADDGTGDEEDDESDADDETGDNEDDTDADDETGDNEDDTDADDETGDNEDDTDADDETGDDEDDADPGDGGEGDDPDDGEGA